MWRIGDYDVNIVEVLLQREGLFLNWHDQRHTLQPAILENLVGILWNVESASIWGRILGGRHWIALLRGINNKWINLDSALAEPIVYETHDDCIALLNSKVNAHILLVERMVI